MNNMTKQILIFMAGVSVGAVVSWFFTKNKYEQIADEEIESVKQVFYRRTNDLKDEKAVAMDIIRERGYNLSDETNESDGKEGDAMDHDSIYPIDPDCLGDNYNVLSLTYYADDVLTDEQDEEIEDPSSTVGDNFRSYFGLYEEDSAFVRNDAREIDYEILKDSRTYAQALKDYEA